MIPPPVRDYRPEPLSELESLARSMEGAVQLAGTGRVALESECELWEARAGMAPGGMGADPKRSLEGLARLSREPSLTPREAALVEILRCRLRRHAEAGARP